MSATATLSETNPYMRDAEMRERLVFRSVATSSAIEGIRAPFKNKTGIVGTGKSRSGAGTKRSR